MGRIDRAGLAGTGMDNDVVAAQAWSAAFDDADISAALGEAFDVEEIDFLEVEDDLLSLIAQRPSRRARSYPQA